MLEESLLAGATANRGLLYPEAISSSGFILKNNYLTNDQEGHIHSGIALETPPALEGHSSAAQ
jgi:hypothetical protein